MPEKPMPQKPMPQTPMPEVTVQGQVRVAVVDDHALVRDGIAALLRGADAGALRVDMSYVGESVTEAITSRPEVLLLDIHLGDGAPTLTESVQAAVGAGAQVLLLSATASASTVLSGLRAGALGFVPKRASLEELIDAVCDVVRGEVHLTTDLAAMLTADEDRPALSAQELAALRLYASGLKIATVARRMDVSPHTVKEYLDRVRAKYAQAGRQARTRTELYAAAQRDGLLEPG